MRVRWVQELSARAAWELAQRLLARDRIDDADVIPRGLETYDE